MKFRMSSTVSVETSTVATLGRLLAELGGVIEKLGKANNKPFKARPLSSRVTGYLIFSAWARQTFADKLVGREAREQMKTVSGMWLKLNDAQRASFNARAQDFLAHVGEGTGIIVDTPFLADLAKDAGDAVSKQLASFQAEEDVSAGKMPLRDTKTTAKSASTSGVAAPPPAVSTLSAAPASSEQQSSLSSGSKTAKGSKRPRPGFLAAVSAFPELVPSPPSDAKKKRESEARASHEANAVE
jgi:hypothetical protein